MFNERDGLPYISMSSYERMIPETERETIDRETLTESAIINRILQYLSKQRNELAKIESINENSKTATVKEQIMANKIAITTLEQITNEIENITKIKGEI